jgi:hypothetical protein
MVALNLLRLRFRKPIFQLSLCPRDVGIAIWNIGYRYYLIHVSSTILCPHIFYINAFVPMPNMPS